MRTIIAGSRTGTPEDLAQALNACPFTYAITIVLSGTAQGIDRAGEQWARENGIPLERYPAQWTEHGKAAGLMRNAEMADRADALVAVWDGKSKVTENMISQARRKGLEVFVWPS